MAESLSSTKRRRLLVGIIVGAVVAAALVWWLVATLSGSGSSRPGAESSPASSASAVSSTPGPTAIAEDMFPQLEPVPPTEVVETDDLAVRIDRVEHVTGEPVGGGEVAGPALLLEISIINDGDNPLDLGLVVVNAYYGANLVPANTFQRPGGIPFEGTLAPGDTGRAVLLFGVPEDEQGDVAVTVDYRPGQPAVVFEGSFR